MTLIVGLKSEDSIVIAAEQEEGCGIAAKRQVNKLRLITGNDWAVVVGGAGDAVVAENAMRQMENKIKHQRGLTEDNLQTAVDEVLDSVYTKYIDKTKDSEGIALVVGAVCGDELHLISTMGRAPQFQDYMAYAGIGADVAIYFIDRLHYQDLGWKYALSVASFVMLQVKESSKYCSGNSDIYVLQPPPNPRWRSLGPEEGPQELESHARNSTDFPDSLIERLKDIDFHPDWMEGYADEHHPEPITDEEIERRREGRIAEHNRQKQAESNEGPR